jgi:hydroxysqualene dehydroxylase
MAGVASVTAPRRAYVLGGGVAGLAAAFGLADRGYATSLLESRKQCGGRAFSSSDRKLDRPLDNGCHVMLGCYRGMRSLLRRLGQEDGFQKDRSLEMVYRFVGDRRAKLKLLKLPVPLAMPLAMMRLEISLGARLRALRGMACVLFGAPRDETFAGWLARRGQQGEPDEVMWRPLCRAVMNVEPEDASASEFLATLREAFMGRAGSAAFWVPNRTWSSLLGGPAPAALESAGVQLRTGARVTSLRVVEGRVAAIMMSDEVVEVGRDDLVISAMPWFALGRVLKSNHELGLPLLRSSPIVTAYFDMDSEGPGDDGLVVALVNGSPFHFLLREPGAPVGQFALLSGGDRSFDGKSVAEIQAIAKEQLQRFYPGVSASGARVSIRKEQHATFVADTASIDARPVPGVLPNGPENLLVCGDWTATGLPSTLEGAVRSSEQLLAKLP